MPQMAPLSWINLFLVFVMMFMLMSIMNYFSYSYNIKPSSIMKSKIQFNWKW